MSERFCSTGEPPLFYTVRSSPRARRVTLRVVPGRGLVVSVPRRFARRDVPAVVEAHRAWAESALAELARRTPEACRRWPPETLELAAVGRRVAVRLCPPDPGATAPDRSLRGPDEGKREEGRRAGTRRPRAGGARWVDGLTLEIAASADDRVGVATAAAAALRAEGRRVLVPRLEALAARHALDYARVAVRGQRSVWGSCSSRGTVSLNYKLLFLSPALVDYVLLHELVHTRHLDHSAAFWRLLESVSPDARALDRELRSAGDRVPPWLELARGGGAGAG